MGGARESLKWDDVRVFLAVHRNATMAGAARALKIDQTTIGRRLAALEESLDARLFDRTPEGLVLTPAGEGILDLAERVEESMQSLERRAGGEDARVEGVVRIATSDSFAEHYLLPRLGKLRERHPSILVEVRTGPSFVALSRREADIAVRLRPKGSPPAQENVVCRKLVEMGFAFHASRAYLARKGTPKPPDFSGHDLVGLDDEAAPLPGKAPMVEAARTGTIVLRASGLPGLLGAARGGIGVAMLPCFMAKNHELVRIGGIADTSDGWMLVHPDLQRVGRIRAVMDCIVEIVREDLAWLQGHDDGAKRPT